MRSRHHSRCPVSVVIGLVLTVPFSSAHGGEAVQTQWSGGPGQVGPVVDLGAEFWCDTGCQWERSEDDLYLEYSAEEKELPGFSNNYTASADLDGDGDSDLVMADNYGGYLYWLENQGQGSVWLAHEIDTEIDAQSAACTDLDGDGDSDIVLGLDWALVCYWNTPEGWVSEAITYGACLNAKPFDMDNDGDMDLMVVSWDPIVKYTLSWLENEDGTGSSWNEHFICQNTSGACFYGLGICDFDYDGDLDVATSRVTSSDTILWLENPGDKDAGWNQHLIGTAENPMGLEAGDIDGDGDADIALVHAPGTIWRTAWFRNDGSGWTYILLKGFDSTQPWLSSIHILDLDSDGDQDFTATSWATDPGAGMVWMENPGTGGSDWLAHLIKTGDYGNYISSSAIADFNQDGNPDVACTNGEGAYWFDLLRFPPEGYLDSSILDTGEEAHWNDIVWSSFEPEGTDLWFQVRSSEDGDPAGMGSWSEPVNEPGSLSELLTDGHRYCQYRVILASTNGDSTPELQQVSISWMPFSSSAGTSTRVDELSLICTSNPSTGSMNLVYSIPDGRSARLSVYDISGHLCRSIGPGELEDHGKVTIAGLPSGAYLVRLESEGTDCTRSIVLLH